ncbi:hypothetical protein HanPI659440_Chr17g0682591 [Helianthus annuus]|nr:hypothetical protein HanPI659440_Chr17g0682591 [Helianthus annuus]
MEKGMQGLKLGGYKLKINRARFARENGEATDNRESSFKFQSEKRREEVVHNNTFQKEAFIRQGFSYSAAVLNNKGGVKSSEEVLGDMEKVVEVHEEISVFFDLQGRAVVGRAKDFSNLIRLKDNLREVGVSGFKLHYFGAMNMMISFEDDVDASVFVLNANMWKEWFETLDLWPGQSMAYERLAWLKFHDMPLHLAENKVFDNVASMFGKVVKGSQMSLNDWDLSTNSVGILVDSGSRITGSVILK